MARYRLRLPHGSRRRRWVGACHSHSPSPVLTARREKAPTTAPAGRRSAQRTAAVSKHAAAMIILTEARHRKDVVAPRPAPPHPTLYAPPQAPPRAAPLYAAVWLGLNQQQLVAVLSCSHAAAGQASRLAAVMTLQFLGYALPGTVMSLFGVAWCWGHAGPRSRHGRHQHPAKADLRLRWPRLAWHRHPVQGVLKLVVSLVGIALGRGHARAALALAFLMEAFLFHHVEVAAEEERGGGGPDSGAAADGRYALRLLVGVMTACGVSTVLCGLAPWPCRGREALDAVRCASAVVHGTWLYHCGLLLYWPPAAPRPRSSSTASSTLWVTLSFAWHCAAATSLLIVFLVARRSACASRRQRHHRDHSPASSPSCPPCPCSPAAVVHPFGLRGHHHQHHGPIPVPVRVLGVAGGGGGL
ncbi:Transmembrane protein 45B, partial [Frankliniella fusca]